MPWIKRVANIVGKILWVALIFSMAGLAIWGYSMSKTHDDKLLERLQSPCQRDVGKQLLIISPVNKNIGEGTNSSEWSQVSFLSTRVEFLFVPFSSSVSVTRDMKIVSKLASSTVMGRLVSESERTMASPIGSSGQLVENFRVSKGCQVPHLWLDNGSTDICTVTFRWTYVDGQSETHRVQIQPKSLTEFTVPKGIIYLLIVKDNQTVTECGLEISSEYCSYVYDIFQTNRYKIETQSYR